MSDTTKTAALKERFTHDGLTGVFVDELGWESPLGSVPTIWVGEDTFAPALVASLKGFRIYGITCANRPTRQVMRQVDAVLKELSPERMEVFFGPDRWFWHWPRRTNAGTTTFEAVPTLPNTLPTFLAQRLTGLEFTISDHRKGFTLVDVRNRVHGHFDATNVTKKFYDRFAKEHVTLSESITGLPSSERVSYATTLLNRLMFLYFMQKKEFLNGDARYLENTLAAIQGLKGRDHYYSFYRDALLPLFFHKLNERGGQVEDPEIARILGDVPYVNGGIFGHTDLEVKHADDLTVPDAAFERILTFFSEFNWHLDTRPTGNPDEINPEVIGYIFEQYINFASSGKKENGAYYTPHDVTSYMVAQTLVPRILDDFYAIDSVFALLQAELDRYIQPAMLHGWDADAKAWRDTPGELFQCWAGDPTGWTLLDNADAEPSICLPGETWVEAFHRRERVESLRERIAQGHVNTVNDLITENLNGQLLLTDVIDQLDPRSAAKLFDRLTELTIFDPTCGSGAFLFAALEVLEDVYSHIVDAALANPDDPAVAKLLSQVNAQPSIAYFIRKHIAIRNLYGTDLMPGAVETAKLRIFLSLAACVDTREELQPLPDLDFNIKAGNLVVGFKDANDVARIGGDLLSASKLTALEPKITAYADRYAEFVAKIETDDSDIEVLKSSLLKTESELRDECNRVYFEASQERGSLETWIESSRPFHWFCEFPDVIRHGGFDVVIGNPPYVRMSQLPEYSVIGYATNNCPDLYAICYERSLSLTHERGRHAFIVMLNLSFSDDYAPLRQVVAKRNGLELWNTYGKRPDSLFRGVQIRNTILVVGPGSGKFSARHTIFGQKDREHVFQCAEHFTFVRERGDAPLRGGISNGLLQSIDSLPAPSGPSSGESLFVRPTGQYWFPVLFAAPPVLDVEGRVIEEHDHSVRTIRLHSGENKLLAGAALAGKIAYAWWSATGDDFHINTDEASIGRKLAKRVHPTDVLLSLAAVVRDTGRTVAFVSKNNDGYINVRWLSVRSITDKFDRALLEAAGLLKHWRALNIWYRQCMKATRANNNSRLLSPEEIDQHLRW